MSETSAIDYFEMLGLDASDAARMRAPALREIVRAKKREWTGQATNPLFQHDARTKLDQIRKFERLLDDAKAMKEYASQIAVQQREKRKRQEHEIGPLVRVACSGRKTVTSHQHQLLQKLACDRSIPESLLKQVMKQLGVQVGGSVPALQGKLSLPYRQPALDRTVLAQIDRWLKVLDRRSFYELLDVSSRNSVSSVRLSAQVLFDKWSKILPKSSECVAWEKSLQACLTYLKDEKAKLRYDAALFNRRVDRFVQQVDLVLAGGMSAKESHVELTRIGMREWGLSTVEISQCIRARAQDMGVKLDKPVAVTVQMQGQCQCTRCFAWSPQQLEHCWNCSGSLTSKCANPACRQKILGNARRCSRCALSVSHGARYVEHLERADDAILRGDLQTADQECRVAKRILASPAVENRLKTISEIRSLLSTAREQFLIKALTSTHHAVVKCLQLAPKCKPKALPSLEQLESAMALLNEQLESVRSGTDAMTMAKTSAQVLNRWSDSILAFQMLWRSCEVLSAKGNHRDAVRYAHLLHAHREGDAYVEKWVDQLEKRLREEEELEKRRWLTYFDFNQAVEENRLYKAERCLQNLSQLGVSPPENAEVIRGRLTDIRHDVRKIQEIDIEETGRDCVIEAYLTVLGRCPDCREALAALQQTQPDLPSPPRDVTVSREGESCRIRWNAGTGGKRPTHYVVKRMDVPTSRNRHDRANAERNGHAPQSCKLVYEGQDRECIDFMAFQNQDGFVYVVEAVYHHRVEVSGNILRDEFVHSLPTVPTMAISEDGTMPFNRVSDLETGEEELDENSAPMEELAVAGDMKT